jgi:hypothetical protein
MEIEVEALIMERLNVGNKSVVLPINDPITP